MLEWRNRFARHTAPMLRERVGDLTDVHIRVLSLLLDLPDHDPVTLPPGSNAILVTHDLTPSLTVQLDRATIAAIATDAGTRTAHVAILARSLGLPAVVGLRTATAELHGGERVVLDGGTGMLAINPTDEEIAAYHERQLEEAGGRGGARRAGRARGGHPRRREHHAARERRHPRGRRGGRAQRRRGRRPDAHRVPRRRPRDDARRGRAVSRLPSRPRGVRGTPGDHPHLRHRRRQAPDGRLSHRAEPVPRLARDPDVPRSAGDVPHAAARAAPRVDARQPADHAPAHRHARRGARRATAARGIGARAHRARRPASAWTSRSA